MDTDTTLTFNFPAIHGKEVTADFKGGDITSDAGVLLLAQADRKVGIIDALSREVIDTRQASKIKHSLATLLRQRIFAIACGYEDANDFDTLASDPALKIACGRAPKTERDLASQPTISRLENRLDRKDIYCMAFQIARRVISQLPKKTRNIIIDIDAYEDPCHGQQEFEFFNGFYDSHCYLPLAVFVTPDDGVRRLLGAILRPGTASQAGVRAAIRIAVKIIRERFPDAAIVLRADGGFGNAKVLELCDNLQIQYSLGLASNARLQALSSRTQRRARRKYTFDTAQADLPAGPGVYREFGQFEHQADTWRREHRIVVKAEITRGELNVRYIVTDLYKSSPEKAYDFYCGRGDAENGIKEFKLDMFAGRTSCHRFLANQFRLLLHVAATVLMSVVHVAAKDTEFARAQAGTIRLRLLKIGARVIESTRRIWLHMSSSFLDQTAWRAVYDALAP